MEEIKTTTIRVKKNLYAAFEKMAKDNDRSINKEIERAMKEYANKNFRKSNQEKMF